MKQYLNWDDNQHPIQWDNNPYTWDGVFIIIEVINNTGGVAEGWKKLDKEKKQKLIKMIATIKDQDFKEEKYHSEDIKVIVKDIQILAERALGIKLKMDK